jgi:hypothetical protein
MERTHLRRDKFWTFDIETTTLFTGFENGQPVRNAIIWSGQFYDGVDYIQTRNLYDTIKMLKLIEDDNKDNPYKIVVFVHNLSYEFQFIKDFFEFEKILCTSTRKIIAAETEQIVFRCSYFLSNQNLDNFLKNENVPEKYRKTNMDYLVRRFPWTELTEEEKVYCANDVIGLHIALEHRISQCHNEDINNLPLTSTGYVRKACRKAVNSNKNNRYRFKKERLDKETFLMCHSAFRGGNTHANRLYVGKLLHNLGQEDVRSEYPAMLLLFDYPTKFFDMKPFKQNEFDYYLKNHKKWAMLIKVVWKNIRLKDPDASPVPYLSTSKCDHLAFNYSKKDTKAKKKYKKSLQVDNGRVLEAAYLETIITEEDYLTIKEQYIWQEEKITQVKVSKKKPIPKELREQILKFFYDKTTLKQDEDDPDFDLDIAYNYARSKELLNGIYGMHVTNPCKEDFTFNPDTHEVESTMRDEEELLNEYYESFSSFLSYQVGIWCTSYARAWLQRGMNLCIREEKQSDGKIKKISDLIYCDTDSCKYINKALHKPKFEKLNKEIEKLAEKRKAYIDYNGKRYYLGVWESDPDALEFKTFGAKKYMYSYMKKEKDGSVHKEYKITISGVNKKKGKECIEEAIKKGKIKDFFDIKKGFCFHGIKTTSCYMDHTKVHEYEVDGRKVYYASNIAMYPNSYTLGLTYEFEILLDKYKDIMEVEANYE